MPRLARIYIPGLLQYVMVRGIEKRAIFFDDVDRYAFVDRLGTLLQKTGTECLAWALLSNHFHLLLRPKSAKLSLLMRRLLTGYGARPTKFCLYLALVSPPSSTIYHLNKPHNAPPRRLTPTPAKVKQHHRPPPPPSQIRLPGTQFTMSEVQIQKNQSADQLKRRANPLRLDRVYTGPSLRVRFLCYLILVLLFINALLQLMSVFETVNFFTEVFYEDIYVEADRFGLPAISAVRLGS